MNWNAKDIQIYLEEKDYIDTVVIPLLPITFGANMKHSAEKGEFIQLLSIYFERQFKGRMLVLPPYTYLEGPVGENGELKTWVEKAKQIGFSHVFLLTSDKYWKESEEDWGGTLFHIPSVPLEHMDDQYKHSIMESQLKLLMDDVIQAWQKGE